MSIEYRTTGPPVGNSGSPLIGELQAVFDVLDDTEIVARLSAYRWTGRKGWSLRTLWKSYVAAYAMNIATTNDLIRRLQDDAPLRFICGFDDGLPSRWTFNRFYIRLAAHSDLVEKCLDSVTDQLGQLLPGFGSSVAVDATTVRTHSNPDKRIVSDAKASWTAKQGTQGKKIWHFGYKLHLVADTEYELPVGFTVTTAKRQDTQEFIPALERSVLRHGWFRPKTVSADAGYDADANYKFGDLYTWYHSKPLFLHVEAADSTRRDSELSPVIP